MASRTFHARSPKAMPRRRVFSSCHRSRSGCPPECTFYIDARPRITVARLSTKIAPPWHLRCTFARIVKPVRCTVIDRRDLPAIEPITLRRILRYVRPYRSRAAVIVGCILLGAILNLAPAWLVKRIVDVAIPRGDLPLLWLCCGGMIAGPLAAGFFPG